MYKYVKSNTLTYCNLTITNAVPRNIFQLLSTEKISISGMVFGKFKKLNSLNLTLAMLQFLTNGRNSPMVKLVKWTLNTSINIFF